MLVMISCTVQNKEVSPAKGSGLNRFSSRLCNSKTINFPKIFPVECLHSPLLMIRTDHLKLLFVGDFSKSPLKCIVVCLLCCFVFVLTNT